MIEHYRLRDTHEENGIKIRVEIFKTIKETEKGYWVVSEYSPSWLSSKELIERKFAKFVLKNSNKKYCYPSIEKAIESFKIRKERQKKILKYQFEQVVVCTKNLQKLDGLSCSELNGLQLGVTPSHYLFCFE